MNWFSVLPDWMQFPSLSLHPTNHAGMEWLPFTSMTLFWKLTINLTYLMKLEKKSWTFDVGGAVNNWSFGFDVIRSGGRVVITAVLKVIARGSSFLNTFIPFRLQTGIIISISWCRSSHWRYRRVGYIIVVVVGCK